jgi:hypothetical protein
MRPSIPGYNFPSSRPHFSLHRTVEKSTQVGEQTRALCSGIFIALAASTRFREPSLIAHLHRSLAIASNSARPR